MQIIARSFQMKNGEKCVLRSPEARDAAQRIAFLRQVNAETPYMARGTDNSPEDIWLVEDILEDQLRDGASLEIAAFAGGEMIACGNIGPVSRAYPRTRHRARFGICVRKGFWAHGLGGAILETLICEAPAMGYSQIELNVNACNERAMGLYRKHGFIETGRTPNAVKYGDGSFADEIQMIRIL